MVTGQQVVEAARRYIGTPFKLHGRDKSGIDCVGLAVCIAKEFGLSVDISDYDENGIPFDQIRTLLLGHRFDQISLEHMRPGDLQTGRNLISGVATGVSIVAGVGGPSLLGGISRIIHCETFVPRGYGVPRMRVVEDSIGLSDMMMASSYGLSLNAVRKAIAVYRYPFVCESKSNTI